MIHIYLAGAIQAFEGVSDEAKKWRDDVKDFFEKYTSNFNCISPMDYYSYRGRDYKTYREVMRFDLRKVRESDIILANLNCIRESIGTCDEIFYAYMLGKPIIGFLGKEISTNDELVNYVHDWKYEQIDRIETGKDALEKACEYIKNFYWKKGE